MQEERKSKFPLLYGKDCTLEEIIEILEHYVDKLDIINGSYGEYYHANMGLEAYKKIKEIRDEQRTE